MIRNYTTPLTTVVLLIALAVFPLVVGTPYYIHLASLALIFVIVAQGLNLIQGYTGYISIAQGSFMGVGAYASALLERSYGFPVWMSIPAALVICAGLGFLIGWPTLRVRGHYFAIVTLAYNMVIWIILLNATWLTGGDAGLMDIPRPEGFSGVLGMEIDFSSKTTYYYLTLIIAALAMLLARQLVKSRVGRVLAAIRQNETLAEATGVRCLNYKVLAFTLSATYAGLGGTLYAHYIGFINPTPFGVETSLNMILAVILGGSGTLWGPALGAVLVTFLPEYLRIAETYRFIAYGLLLILTTIWMPRGLVPVLSHAVQAAGERLKVSVGKKAPKT